MEVEQKCALKQLEITRTALKKLRTRKNTCDVRLVCGEAEEILTAHRSILRAGSSYFEAMFSNDMKEAASNRVTLPTINCESMELVLEFIYLQKVTVADLLDKEVWKLLSAAHLLEVSPLVEICAVELCSMITNKNWIVMLQTAHLYSLDDLLSAVVQHFAQYKWNEDDALAILDIDCFNTLVSNSSRQKCFSQDTLIELILRWASYDKTDRKTHLTRLLSHVNFGAVSKDMVTNVINDNELFTKNLELAHFLLQKLYPTSVQPVDSHTAAHKPKLRTPKPKAHFSIDDIQL